MNDLQTLPWRNPLRVAALEAALAERILVIDGAMGTMIQRHELRRPTTAASDSRSVTTPCSRTTATGTTRAAAAPTRRR